MTNAHHIRGSAWIRFPHVLCETWHHNNLVLLGDASATAHFSIGSGTKLALESAAALARTLVEEPSHVQAFDAYEEERRIEVLRLQSAARNSMEWFENVERYLKLDPVQLNYSMLTRSQRISHENLRERDPVWLTEAERWFQDQAGASADAPVRSPMFAPFRLRDMHLSKPRCGLANGAVQSRERPSDRLALCSLRRTSQGRCWSRLRRNDVCVTVGPHYPWVPRPLRPRTRSGVAPLDRLCARRDRGQNLLPDRSFRTQGINTSWLGRNGCTTAI